MTIATVETPKYQLTIQSDGKTVSVDTGSKLTLNLSGIASATPTTQTLAIRTVTAASVTITVADATVLLDCSSNSITADLPSASTNEGQVFRLKKIDASSFDGTLDADGSETIDGDTTKTLSSQWDSITIQSDGTNYVVI